jgi:hypothetical protein
MSVWARAASLSRRSPPARGSRRRVALKPWLKVKHAEWRQADRQPTTQLLRLVTATDRRSAHISSLNAPHTNSPRWDSCRNASSRTSASESRSTSCSSGAVSQHWAYSAAAAAAATPCRKDGKITTKEYYQEDLRTLSPKFSSPAACAARTGPCSPTPLIRNAPAHAPRVAQSFCSATLGSTYR